MQRISSKTGRAAVGTLRPGTALVLPSASKRGVCFAWKNHPVQQRNGKLMSQLKTPFSLFPRLPGMVFDIRDTPPVNAILPSSVSNGSFHSVGEQTERVSTPPRIQRLGTVYAGAGHQ